jgi:hypothetical protein
VPKKTSFSKPNSPNPSFSHASPAGSNFRLFHLALISTLLYAVLCLGLDTWTGVREILVSTDFGPTGRLVEPISTADGETTRNLVITSAPDGRWWIMHAERMAREGVFRLRETQSDNPPTGREVHWSSLQMWNLIALSRTLEIFPKPQGLSGIEWAALFVGPVTWMVFFLIGLFLSWKVFGKEAALAWMLCMLSARSVLYFFRAGEADHHGLVALFAALGILLLAGARVGFFNKGASPKSAWWFAGAGVSTAMGLWISAATQLPILFATALGGILATWIASRKPTVRVNANAWRVWGFTGALASILLYALEYFPSHMGWRLEVNHPLYSLAWLAGGELMCRITEALGAHSIPKLQWRDHIVLGLCAIAILLPAAFIVFGGERVFVVSDPFLYALHDYFINEFMSLIAVAKSTGYHYALFSYSFTIAALLVVALGICRRGVPKEQFAVLVFASLPVLIMTLLAIRQIRWSGTASAMVIPMVLAAMWLILSKPAPNWRVISAWAVLLLATLPTSVAIVFRVMDAQERGNMVDQSIVPSVVTRDICQRLAATAPGKRLVVLASPSTSTEIIYYGGAKALGTLYWENLEGLRKAADIYSLRDENEALRRIQELGVTHILLFSWDSFGQRYVRLQRGLGKDDEARDGFIPALLEGTRPQPTWLTPLYYPLPEEYKLGNDQWVRIYAVAPGQSKADWFHGIAIYQLDAGKEDLAERSLRESLALQPGKVDSRIALLLLLATQQRPQELSAEVQSAIKNMGANGHNLIQQAAVDLAKSNQTSAADALLKALSDNDNF